MSRQRLLRLLPAILWTVLISVLLTMPGSYVPGKVWNYDKIGHFCLFAGFAYLWVRGLGGPTARTVILIAAAGLFYGIGSELFQEWLGSSRAGDPMDVLANLCGLAAGLLATTLHRGIDSEGRAK